MSDAPTIEKRFVVNLKGRDYPTWPGILDAATSGGLRSLTTRIVQIPSPENGQLAVVMARAEFEDGRVFEDVGDASPANCSAQIATAALRMASTRAKGRVLRDAMNAGQTLLEEMPDAHEADYSRSRGNGNGRQQQAAPKAAPPPPQEEAPPPHCQFQDCGAVLTRDEINAAIKYAEAYEGGKYCTEHGRPLVRVWKQARKDEPVMDEGAYGWTPETDPAR